MGAITAFQAFLSTNLEKRLEQHLQVSPEGSVLKLFHSVAATTPAYRAFLKEHGIDPASIKTFEDFQELPIITKENYMRCHPLAHLCRNGKLETCDMIAVSSGSTGKPMFWPRSLTDEFQIATRFEQIFHDSFYDSASLYGTADAGVLGNETPLSICIRRFLAERPDAARALFGESRLPTLVQYDPLSRFFETHNGTLLFSGDNGIPLVRYDILDTGGIISYDEMIMFLGQWKFDPVARLQEIGGRGIYSLPFVYVFGRSHFTVSYFGAKIYPENVTAGLEQPAIRDWVTGRFVLQVKEDADQNKFLSVVVELAPGVEGSEEKQAAIASSILSQLLRLNSEFANYVPLEYQMPRVTLAPVDNPEYFPVGIKHRYTGKGGSN